MIHTIRWQSHHHKEFYMVYYMFSDQAHPETQRRYMISQRNPFKTLRLFHQKIIIIIKNIKNFEHKYCC